MTADKKGLIYEFTKKGLLFWGVATLIVAFALSGAFFSEWAFTDMLFGLLLGALLFFVYNLTLTVSERCKTRVLYLYASVLSAVAIVVIAVSQMLGGAEILSAPSFLPELSLFAKSYIFGAGFAAAKGSGGCLFLRILISSGLFGMLALLTNLKHMLEVAIRRFSAKKLLLLAVCIAILLCPLGRLDAVSILCLTALYILFAGLAEAELTKIRLARINNTKPLEEGRKPRVLFPFIEAGKGHITPATAVCEIFKRKYGDKVEVVESAFYSETENSDLVRTEKLFAAGVQMQNKRRVLSFLCRLGNFLAGDVFAQYVLMAMTRSGVKSKRPAAEHLRELDADLIFTTHWSIPFYINHIMDKTEPRPYTVMFCPDVYSNGMFNMDCNKFIMPMKSGHNKIARIRMYAGGNTQVVPFPLRNEVYKYEGQRDALRETYGIAKDAFVVTLCDGGYGMANLEDTVKELLHSKEEMTLIALCGTNEKLYERMRGIVPPKNITLMPMPFTDKVLEYLALSDLFVGKSGANSMAEPAFFGVPIIVTRCATYIERHIKDHYVHHLGGALYIPVPKLAARKIAEFAKEPEKLEKYKKGLEAFRANCGAEAIADMLYGELANIGYKEKEAALK